MEGGTCTKGLCFSAGRNLSQWAADAPTLPTKLPSTTQRDCKQRCREEMLAGTWHSGLTGTPGDPLLLPHLSLQLLTSTHEVTGPGFTIHEQDEPPHLPSPAYSRATQPRPASQPASLLRAFEPTSLQASLAQLFPTDSADLMADQYHSQYDVATALELDPWHSSSFAARSRRKSTIVL